MQNQTLSAPSPNADAFAAFLSRLSSLAEEAGQGSAKDPESDKPLPQPFSAEPSVAVAELEPDWSTISYENALREPARETKEVASPAMTAAPPLSAPVAEKGGQTEVQAEVKSGLALASQSGPRTARATVRLTVEENTLLRTRATETGLTVSSYIRACVLEVESLRQQVRQMAKQMHCEKKPAAIEDEPLTLPQAPTRPVLSAPSFSEVFAQAGAKAAQIPPPQPTSSPRQPLPPRAAERAPRPRHHDPRVQAALEAERVRIESRRSAASAPVRKEESKRGLFGLLFGSRRGA